MFIKYAAIVIGAYLLGSMSISILLSGAVFGKDIRTAGSGNAGATNMARVFGWGAGLLTLAGDAAKAVVSILAGRALGGELGLALAGMACIFGHCYPVFHRFKGGKGVSVGGVIAFCIDWRVGLCVVGAFLVGALLSKKVSVGSIMGALAITVSTILFGLSAPRIALAVFGMTLCIWRHRGNIKRLIAGTEPDFKAHKKEEAE